MYIKELHIYGYGKFEQYSFTNIDSLQVIYGENEAGKSTVMSFIQSILFGFPLKQQSELRYEPKIHSKYGGRLVLDIPKFGEVIIERVKGKAAGDVTVTLSDGTRGGEELLEEVISGLDKYTFQSIYSFNIHGLQNVQKLRGEDISKFLFSASAVGSDKIMEIEAHLVKEMEKLFKPNGIKPELNRQLADLREIEAKLNEAKKKNSAYSKLVIEMENLVQSIQKQKEKMELLGTELYEKKEWNRIYPYLMKQKQLHSQIEELGDESFPQEGMSRLEKLQAELASIVKRLPSLESQKEDLELEISQIHLHPHVHQYQEDLQKIVDGVPQYLLNIDTANELSLQKEQIRKEMLFLSSKLGFQEDFSVLTHMDVSFAKKDIVRNLVQQQQQLVDKQRELAKREEEVNQKISETQNLINHLNEMKLSANEKQRLQAVLKMNSERQKLESEYQMVSNQFNQFSGANRAKTKNNPAFVFILLFILAILIVTPLFFNFWQLTVGVIVATIIFSILLFVNKEKGTNNFDSIQVIFQQLQEQKTILENRLSELKENAEGWEHAEQILEQDAQLEGQINIEKMKLSQYENQHEIVIADFESWEEAWRENESARIKLGHSISLSEQMAKNYLLEAFEYIEKLKGKLIEYQSVTEKLNSIQCKITEKESQLSDFERVLSLKGSNYQDKVSYIKTLLSTNNDLYQKYQEKITKLSDVEQQLQTWKEEEKVIKDSLGQLFSDAMVDSKEAFIEKAKQVQKRMQLEEQLQMVKEQLFSISPNILERYKEIDYIFPDTLFDEIESEKLRIKQKIDQLELEKAAIQYELNILEEGGTYSELLHRYHQQKYEFNETAKKWATFSTARYILESSMEKYKTEKLPLLLVRASNLFTVITGGKYKRIFTDPNSDQIFVEHQTGVVFIPEELSQATHEQLFLSIRFALSQQLSGKINVPIFIDDGFVHFDESRLVTTLQLLKEIAQSRQVFLFTCHKEVVHSFEETRALHLQA